ncbi:MAG: 30S ribosomal protein S3 [Candidatus Firestonebacteria bacterium]|nr:30S ribosomal protein S3 [Candidatus Firestonebacteria bacterium]
MGQKVNPIGIRLGITRTWDSQWFAKKNFSALLLEDTKLRKFLKAKLGHAGISKIEIERASQRATISIYAAKPGIIIGKKGSEIENLRKELQALTDKQIHVNILEVKRPELDATLVAESVARQLERRIAFRRAMKRSVTTAMDMGAKGIKVMCGGRLAGAEIARREWYREGRVPLHTLRADIQYGLATANTTYGTIGVKVWLFVDRSAKAVEERRGGKRNAPAKES